MANVRPILLELEIKRVNLLYKLNFSGVIALLIYSFSYAYICGDVLGHTLLKIWLSLVLVSAVLRIWGSLHWFKIQSQVVDYVQVKRWLRFIQALLGVSGIVWGITGWMAQYAQTPLQQIFTALTLTFMAAGALVCWSVSLPAMFLVVLPSVLPWSLGFLLSGERIYIFMGFLVFTYLILGSKVAISLNSYVVDSIRLTIEKAQLTADLKKEIAVKKQTEESLQLALSSSDAMSWRWNSKKNIFQCEGDLQYLLGLNLFSFSGSLQEFMKMVAIEDRKILENDLQLSMKNDGNIDTDVRVLWPDGRICDLALRGRAYRETEADFNIVTGIAWNATDKKSQLKLQQERNTHEAANKAKSVFLANASHEMRTPLAAIEGFTEVMLQNFNRETFDKEEMRSDLQAISRNGKYLISLMNDFLDLSKIESSRYYIQKSVTNLKNEIGESVKMVKLSIDQKGLIFKVQYEANLPELIETDSTRFRQILVNLLSNAIKFTEHGEISMHVGSDKNRLKIRIRDTGLGMDEATQSHLYEPFTRGTSPEIQKQRGSGLGLALSRNLARLLGGNLRLVFSKPGEGSEFELNIEAGLTKFLQTPINIKTEKTESGQLQGSRILVVDDDEDLRGLMKRYLVRNGAEVDTSQNGAEAIEKATLNSYDAILMDMKMPVIDGYQATRSLRTVGYDRSIIAVTAHASTEDMQKSLDSGCDFYLSKPIDLSAMITVLVGVIKNKS